MRLESERQLLRWINYAGQVLFWFITALYAAEFIISGNTGFLFAGLAIGYLMALGAWTEKHDKWGS